jgi:methylated-DNA-[protein]-cysteine S-methyltransferase
MLWTTMDSPLGELLLVGEASPDAPGGVLLDSVSVPGQKGGRTAADAEAAGWRRDDAAFAAVTTQLGEYFAGTRTGFQLACTARGTAFQQRVWQALEAIPFGGTTTYGALAASLGLPRSAARAIGTAVGRNPLMLLRPCHRVIGADGSLTGYAGGLPRKELLLRHEGVLPRA